jgi:hypothetical protein
MVLAYLVALVNALDSFAAEAALPSVEISRHFVSGGYESLVVKCRPDTTRADGLSCDLRRLRNGVEVSKTVVEYRWAEAQLGRFIREVAAVRSGESSGTGHLLLTYDAQNQGQRLQGRIHRQGEDTERTEQVKALLSLEGALASQFYR